LFGIYALFSDGCILAEDAKAFRDKITMRCDIAFDGGL